MKKTTVGLSYKNRKVFLKVKKCGYLDEAFGLMFKKKEKAEALLFDFSGRKRLALHSFFVFFPFLAIWLDDKNKILYIKSVKPFSFDILPQKAFTKIIEVPISSKYRKIIKKLVGKRKI
jgi:uncharacterized membrane protein (UPF0127 family)